MERLLIAISVLVSAIATNAERVYLSGKGPSDAVEWDFKVSKGRKSDSWAKIPVPSNWEQEGFGGYDYGHVAPQDKNDEAGTYRVKFHAPAEWRDKVVRLVFEGSMTDTSIKVNGKPVGSVHQGGYDRFHFTLTDTGRYGQHAFNVGKENVLEVLVSKKSANASLEVAERKADYWVFGGIYCPVYFEVLPKTFINRVAIDANADGRFSMDVFPQVHLPRHKGGGNHVDEIVAQIETLDGKPVGKPVSATLSGGGASRVKLESELAGVKPWSMEHPNLYNVHVSLKREGKTLHETRERFGFRTFEVRAGDGLYLNGKKLLIRGVNRNGFRPDTARALDPEEEWEDARAIKEMNANAVRCHLPPSTSFLEACDELGLLFVTERTNWQRPVTDTLVAREIVYNLVTQVHNHPCLVMWANGNEGGFNHEVDELFALLDKQERPVIHPWATFDDIDTWHYVSYGKLREKLEKGTKIFLPTELLHGLFDGGHGAGLEEYWKLMRKYPLSAGGFLWCWGDAALLRTDQNGKLDTDGNHSADGIVGPYGEKEASWYTIREIWSPIHIPLETLPSNFDGVLPVENRFNETNLKQCLFGWRTMDANGNEVVQRALVASDVAPGKTGELVVPLTGTQGDILQVVAIDPTRRREIMSWSWPLRAARIPYADRGSDIRATPVAGNLFHIKMGDTEWKFSEQTGQLLECSGGIGKGPVLYAASEKDALVLSNDWKAKAVQKGDSVVIDSANANGSRFTWTLKPGGGVKLDYAFAKIDEALTYCAVGFDLAEDQVASKRWLGDGPFRIWGNRQKGGRYGLWENEYNDGITGVNWIYPEFKGIFGNVDWMQVEMKSGAKILVETEPGSDVGVLRPKNAVGDKKTGPRTATWSYPGEGGLFLFHKVPAVGTKFKEPSGVGPQGAPKQVKGLIEGEVVFHVQ